MALKDVNNLASKLIFLKSVIQAWKNTLQAETPHSEVLVHKPSFSLIWFKLVFSCWKIDQKKKICGFTF